MAQTARWHASAHASCADTPHTVTQVSRVGSCKQKRTVKCDAEREASSGSPCHDDGGGFASSCSALSHSNDRVDCTLTAAATARLANPKRAAYAPWRGCQAFSAAGQTCTHAHTQTGSSHRLCGQRSTWASAAHASGRGGYVRWRAAAAASTGGGAHCAHLSASLATACLLERMLRMPLVTTTGTATAAAASQDINQRSAHATDLLLLLLVDCR